MVQQYREWVHNGPYGIRRTAERSSEAKSFGTTVAELRQDAMDSGADRCGIKLAKVQAKATGETDGEGTRPGFHSPSRPWTMLVPSQNKNFWGVSLETVPNHRCSRPVPQLGGVQ